MIFEMTRQLQLIHLQADLHPILLFIDVGWKVKKIQILQLSHRFANYPVPLDSYTL